MSFTSYLTGGLIDPSNTNYAGLSASKEAQRKGLINLGLGQINSVFSGGTSPFYSIAPQKRLSGAEWATTGRSQPYYSINRQGEFAPFYAPRPSGGKGGFTGQGVLSDLRAIASGVNPIDALSTLGGLFGSDKQPTQLDIINARLKKGLLYTAPEYKTFEGFQPEFFRQRAQDYVNFALPQEAQQYQQSRNALLYGLSNRGLGASSVAQQASSDLERTAGQAKQTIADTGLEQANQLQKDIENARQQAIQQLYQTADPSQATQGAISAASQFQKPSIFAPLGNLFSNLAQQYYVNQVLKSQQQPFYGYGQGSPNYSMALGPGTY